MSRPLQLTETPDILHAMQGTDRDDEHLNIFLEFVPGGSIASLLTKFGEPQMLDYPPEPGLAMWCAAGLREEAEYA